MTSAEKITAPYGSWKSPITADVVSGAEKDLGGTAVDSHGRLYWLESRPTESGRTVLVKEPENPGDDPKDITPKEFSVGSVVNECTGGAFQISGDTLIFSNYEDLRLYKQLITSDDSLPMPITPDYGGSIVCYADGEFDSRFNRYVTVREDHRESNLNPTTTIVSISLGDNNIQEPKVLVGGSEFYAFPRIDLNGERLAWIEWGYPNMPWDKAELCVGYISENGDIYKCICVAGCDSSIIESPTEPKWSSTGELFFITDRHNGFWNLYKWVDTGKVDGQRLCIAGDSAGGYTTLAALAFKDVFKAGASLYGIADLPLVRAQSHKFESYYTDNLVGSAEDYFERSPINFVDKFSCPVILFQGLEDKSVSPEQAQKICAALKEKGLPVALMEYEGEGHGFGKKSS